MQLLQKLAEAKDENGLLSQALQDLQVRQMPLRAINSRMHTDAVTILSSKVV